MIGLQFHQEIYILKQFFIYKFTLFSFTILQFNPLILLHPLSIQPSQLFTLQKGDSPFGRVIDPSKRVNGRVKRVNHPSNSE